MVIPQPSHTSTPRRISGGPVGGASLHACAHPSAATAIAIATPRPVEIVISGIDRQKVGQVAAEIREYRPPEPYKGKGIKYAGERIFRKEGKKK